MFYLSQRIIRQLGFTIQHYGQQFQKLTYHNLHSKICTHSCSLPRVSSKTITTYAALKNANHTELKAGPFGELILCTTGSVNTTIECLNPNEWPLMNSVLVSLINEKGDLEEDEKKLKITQNGHDIHLIINGPQSGPHLSCTIMLPVKFDIDADIKDRGEVSISNLDNDKISVQTNQGSCLLKKIHTGTAILSSQDGDVRCEGLLQGNSSIKTTGTGNIDVHRIQALWFDVETKSGNINGNALYADKTNILTHSGNIRIGSCHRDCSITALGRSNISIDSLDGDLFAKTPEGDITISYVAQYKTIDVSTDNGNINVDLADSVESKVDLLGSNVSVAETIKVFDAEKQIEAGKERLVGYVEGEAVVTDRNADLLGCTERNLVVKTGNGDVRISIGDWFSSLKLRSE